MPLRMWARSGRESLYSTRAVPFLVMTRPAPLSRSRMPVKDRLGSDRIKRLYSSGLRQGVTRASKAGCSGADSIFGP